MALQFHVFWEAIRGSRQGVKAVGQCEGSEEAFGAVGVMERICKEISALNFCGTNVLNRS
jgi:hypothetical protein